MEGVIKLLEGFENLAYRILMLVIIIPKTLLKIIFEPTWVPTYIKSQLEIVEKNKTLDDKSKRPVFVEYFSPVLLLLVLALVPALLLSFLPDTGVDVQLYNGQESAPEGGSVALVQNKPPASSDSFIAKASFSSTAKGKGNKFKWWVAKENSGGGYTRIPSSEIIHRDSDLVDSNILYLDDNTIQDTYSYKFTERGRYRVYVEVSNFSGPIYSNYASVHVKPTDTKEFRAVPDDLVLTGKPRERARQSLTIDGMSNILKKDTTIFLAIALMLPPLFFAYIYGLVTRRNMDEQRMRESFYAECYYFSPLSLAIWAFYYSHFFLTQGTFQLSSFKSGLLLIPPLLALVWFIWVETTALADENEEDNITRPKAFAIVMFCIVVMLVAGLLVYVFTVDVGMRDSLRENLIWPYLGISIVLMAMYIINRRKVRHLPGEETPVNEQDETDRKARRLSFRKLIVPVSVSTIILCCILPMVWLFWPVDTQTTASSSGNLAVTSTPLPPVTGGVATASPVPLYYTEEFDQNNGNWDQYLYDGTTDEVGLSYENGSMHLRLSPQQDQFPSTYLVNNANEYTDVQVETITKSDTKIPSTVSLVCRHNDKGWYEFEISNSGYYNIYQVDRTPVDENNETISYTTLASGNTTALKPDGSENRYKAICTGNTLGLFVNDTSIGTFLDPKTKFKEGRIGVGTYSPESLDVDMEFKSVTIAGPPPQLDLSEAEAIPMTVAEVIPTATPSPETPLYFTEEFDGNLNNWVTLGDESQLKLPPENGSLHFQLSQKDGQTPSVYLINDAAVYGDVQVEVVTTNNGNNSNGVDLICQASDKGWYEFEVSNSGNYSIFALDAANGSYTTLLSGSSAAIRSGLSQNTYTAICKGNELSLVINGTSIEPIQDTVFNFMEGRIGFGVSSRKGFPVDVTIESVTVSEP